MVYKAIQAFLSEKAAAFLPGKDFYPEEDRYASQFDPWSSGTRTVVRPWFNISINIQIGGGEVPAPAPKPTPAVNQNSTTSGRFYESQRGGSSEPMSPSTRERQHNPFERVLGQSHVHGNTSMQDHARAHFGDVHYYNYFYAHAMQRRASSPSETLSRSMAFEAMIRSTKHTDHLANGNAVSDSPPLSPVRRQSSFRQAKK